DYAIRSDDAVFVLHSFTRAQVDPPAGSVNQNPCSRDVTQTDSAFDVSVEASARDIGHVEGGAAEHATLAHAVNHCLQQRQIRIDRAIRFGEPDRNDRFGQIGASAHAKMLTVQTRFLSFLRAPHLVAHRIINYANDDFAFETECDRNTKV